MPKALPGLGQGRAHVLGLDGLAGGSPLAGAAGQGARVTGGVDLIGHVLPVSIGGLGAVVDALKLGGAADGPIEAARAVVVQAGVAEVVLHLGVLLQPVGQGFQLGHGFVNFGAGIGRHRQVGRVAVGIHPHHRAHGGSKGAFGKIRQGKHAVVAVIQPAEGQHPRRQHGIRDSLRRAAEPPALANQHHQHDDGRRPGKGQQEHPRVLAVEIGTSQPHARRQQPGPQRLLFRSVKHGPQGHARHARKENEAQCREDVVPVNAQRVGRPTGGQKRQRPKQPQRQHAAAARLGVTPQRRKGKGRQQRSCAPQCCPADQIRQVQHMQQRQPYREEHGLGEGQIIVSPQPLPRRDGLRRAEHQLVIQRCAAHPGIRLLEAGQAAAQQNQHGHAAPESALVQLQAGMLHTFYLNGSLLF